jgi:hypothetical protein
LFSSRYRSRALIFICAIVFFISLGRLFWLRFDAGDLYPAYSSLRSDPLGVQVLYESLKSVDAQGVDRNFRAFSRRDIHTAPSTYLVCGLTTSSNALARSRWEPLLERTAKSGDRLVFAFTLPSGKPTSSKPEKEESVALDGSGDEDNRGTPDEDDTTAKDETAGGLWGLGFDLNEKSGSVKSMARRQPAGPGHLPATLVWRSHLSFDLYDPAWEMIYALEDRTVVARRSWGAGKVVVLADSYLFSNEGLRNHREPGFLAWVLPPDRKVIFDEFHHGLAKEPGIAALMRKYRLHGVILSLVVVVALILWRQAVVFVPRSEDAENAELKSALGRDSAEGWVSLMQQHIPAANLLKVCHQEWQASAAAQRVPAEQAARVREVVAQYTAAPRRHRLVAAYRTICELLKQGKNS